MELLSYILAIIFFILFFIWFFLKIKNAFLSKKLNSKEQYKNIKKDLKKQKLSKYLFRIIIVSIIVLSIYLLIGLIIGSLSLFMMVISLGDSDSTFFNHLSNFIINYFSLFKFIGYYMYIIVYPLLIREIYINIINKYTLTKKGEIHEG